ncbi:MAG TPA: signal peptidase I [Kofleriaceae bacterium]|jgi:signal peptidase I|nr:signal peptidase I [Kofleriaceae bacterium]
MRAASLDRRIRKEAELLIREGRSALTLKRNLRGKTAELEAAVGRMHAALAAHDYQRVRHDLPALDSLIDELVKRRDRSALFDSFESIIVAVLIALALRAMVLAAFKIPSSSMYPTLEINDHIFVNKILYGLHIPFTDERLVQWRTPHRGEVIVFQQPCTPDVDYIKRVIATAGQSVEVRCNVVYVDGAPIEHQLLDDQCTYEDYDDTARHPEWYTRRCSEYAERVDGHEYFTFHDADRPLRDAQLAKDGSLPSADLNDFPRSDYHTPPSCSAQTDGDSVEAPNQLPGKLVETKRGAGACDLQMHYVVPAGHIFVMGDNRANSKDSRIFGSVPVENVKGKALFIWLSYRDLGLGGLRWARMGSLVR